VLAEALVIIKVTVVHRKEPRHGVHSYSGGSA
jgi:hypothetical protein